MIKFDETVSLAALIRRYRGIRTQESFAHMIGVRQPTLSAWEKGTKLPSEGQLEKIAEAGNGDKDQLKRAWRRAITLSRKAPYSIGRILFEAEEYMQCFGYPSDVWVIGPQGLPVGGQVNVEQHWRELLDLGVDLKFLWFLGLVTADQLHAIVGTLSKLVKVVDPKNCKLGQVIHYATCTCGQPADESTLQFGIVD